MQGIGKCVTAGDQIRIRTRDIDLLHIVLGKRILRSLDQGPRRFAIDIEKAVFLKRVDSPVDSGARDHK